MAGISAKRYGGYPAILWELRGSGIGESNLSPEKIPGTFFRRLAPLLMRLVFRMRFDIKMKPNSENNHSP
jgi:hypothetical protein